MRLFSGFFFKNNMLTFESMINFELTFVEDLWLRVLFLCFVSWVPIDKTAIAPTLFAENLCFSSIKLLLQLWQKSVEVWVVWVCFWFHDCVPPSTVYPSSNAILSWLLRDQGKTSYMVAWPPYFVLLFQMVSAVLELWSCLLHCRISVSISTKNACWDFHRSCIKINTSIWWEFDSWCLWVRSISVLAGKEGASPSHILLAGLHSNPLCGWC